MSDNDPTLRSTLHPGDPDRAGAMRRYGIAVTIPGLVLATILEIFVGGVVAFVLTLVILALALMLWTRWDNRETNDPT